MIHLFTLHVFFLISFVCLHFWVGCAKILIIFLFRLSMGLPMCWNSIVKKELKCFFFSSNLLEFLFGLKITHTPLSDMIMISEWLIIYHYLNLQSCGKYYVSPPPHILFLSCPSQFVSATPLKLQNRIS